MIRKVNMEKIYTQKEKECNVKNAYEVKYLWSLKNKNEMDIPVYQRYKQIGNK